MKEYINKKYKKLELYEECPMCRSKTFMSYSWTAIEWETIHGLCDRCGYMVEEYYGNTLHGFIDIKKGFKNLNGEYIPKNVKRHKRIRRKKHIKGIEVNPFWAYMV